MGHSCLGLTFILYKAMYIQYNTSLELCTWFTLYCDLLWFGTSLLHWHWGNHMIAPMPVNQPWSIWENTFHESIRSCRITMTNYNKTMYFLMGCIVLQIVMTNFMSSFHMQAFNTWTLWCVEKNTIVTCHCYMKSHLLSLDIYGQFSPI